MSVDRPRVRVGIQINNIRALPIELFVVDDGPAPLLLGSDFLRLLFAIDKGRAIDGGGTFSKASAIVSVEAEEKQDADSVGIRLIPEKGSVDALQLERFLRGIREIHNIAVLANTNLHDHDDWPQDDHQARTGAVRETIENDLSLYNENTLTISWVETGSIWLSLKSGSKAALSWVSQLFEKSMDARMRATIAAAASAEEDATVKAMTRDDVVRAKSLEQRRLAAEEIRKTREEWQQTVLEEIDFKEKLAKKIKNDDVREELQRKLQSAIADIVASNFMPVIENVPSIPPEATDPLPIRTEQKQLR